MKNPKFSSDSFYHIYNRGVDKRKIFMDDEDHFRFIHDLYEFNDDSPAMNIYYRTPSSKSYEIGSRKILRRRPIIEILAYCLMPNHYHFFLREKDRNGITKFMQKLGIGYTMYFNQKYKRTGVLFQGKFKAVRIEREAHFLYLPHYIHLNPLDLKTFPWRKRSIDDKNALKFLESYKWSSYLDHIGKKNFPSIISSKLFKQFFGTPQDYRQSLIEWIHNMNLNDLSEITLEAVDII